MGEGVADDSWRTPPTIKRPSHLHLLLWPFRFVVGTVCTCTIVFLLLVLSPFLLLRRLLIFLHRRAIRPTSCDIVWPLTPFTRSVLTVVRPIRSDAISALIAELMSTRSLGCLRLLEEGSQDVAMLESHLPSITDQSKLLDYLNGTEFNPSDTCKIRIVTDFPCPDQEEDTTSVANLLIVSSHPNKFPLCTAQLLSAFSKGEIKVEVEPRIYKESNTNVIPQLGLLVSLITAAFRGLQFLIYGPGQLLAMPFYGPCRVWRALELGPRTIRNIRRHTLTPVVDWDSEEIEMLMPLPSNSPKVAPHFHWVEIDELDNIQRAERLLRASSMELLGAVMAGALRSYFREEGVLHPPCVNASMPVCTSDYSFSEMDRPCKHLLLPIRLPLGVEGAIPRLWALQRRLAHGVMSTTPMTLKAAKRIGSLLLTDEENDRLNSSFYRDCVVQLSFMRVIGNSLLNGKVLHEMMVVPPLGEGTRLSFTFIQVNNKLVLCSTIDRTLIPSPERITRLFKRELSDIMEHLASRLLPLTQSTILPVSLPSSSDSPDEFPLPAIVERSGSSSSGESMVDAVCTPARRAGRRESLDNLLGTIAQTQNALAEIRANPGRQDSSEVIEQLAELEKKLTDFHLSVHNQLGLGDMEQEAAKAKELVQDLFSPYKRRASVTDRRFSREFTVRDSQAERNERSTPDGGEGHR